ncbi:MAG: DUF523 domain-containing protein [Bacillota bacterium]
MIIVSACLCGIPCRYNGSASAFDEIVRLVARGEAMPICPECLGGLGIPRLPCELTDTGEKVLDGQARAVAKDGLDLTDAFVQGARLSLEIARRHGATSAILKANSPSCGCGEIYDGTFLNQKRPGNGVTAALFVRNGIRVQTL